VSSIYPLKNWESIPGGRVDMHNFSFEVLIQHDLSAVDARLPGKGNSNPHGARLVHLIITMIQWIRTSRLSIKNSLSCGRERPL